ncbi:glycosyltransferase family 8 protein [Chelatococcus asaccharovorans]|uniref:Lipopolysaccharide biosynthesis glycosyltransferase n=1 Tax=Chelatococcus asaccharovorans TaxID=28210 RepID=A0A2V3U5H8_9HYPH|nr:glycosyltransferase family 8 protein [Chelatococcus asaccharovorans]MBS7704034.1 glycosyltransferase family 8 protein [Chelatococcus asaccharovorans]PXW58199.1 lipopolysaccharide biosynthesis glycosyltransferase [Chelatococcus asaccharovorans]
MPHREYRAAICLTPDARYFKAAIVAARSILAQEPDIPADIVILCDGSDVAPGYDALPADMRARITLLPWERSSEIAALPLGRHVTQAAYRRLFLPALLAERYRRIVYLDSDVVVVRPGLSRLLGLELAGRPVAAAIDMIFLKDFEEGPLTAEFRAYRAGLGLPLAQPYFNSGLLVIDRDLWREQAVTERALAFLAAAPARCLFHDQSALNAVLHNNWLPLSPRYNFMGDFQLLDLETRIAPIVMHFVNHPKPWHFRDWAGEDRFAQIYRDWLADTPWAADALPSPHALREPAPLTPAFTAFRERLLAYLRAQAFADTAAGWP